MKTVYLTTLLTHCCFVLLSAGEGGWFDRTTAKSLDDTSIHGATGIRTTQD